MSNGGRFRRTSVVLRKELIDGLRDRRSIISLLFSALFGPLVVGFMMTSLAERQKAAEDIKIPIAGAEYAPALVDWLKQQSGVEVIAAPKDPEEAVKQGKEDVVVIVDKEFSQRFSRSLPGGIKVVGDATRDSARPKVQRVRRLLAGYSSQIAAMRLVARGVAPAVASPLQIEDLEVSSAQQRAAKILGFVSMFVIMAAFAGGLQIASDSTAGERERGSLESLLLNPVPREALIAGKWLAASAFGAASVLFSSFLSVLVISRIPLHELGARFRFGAEQFFAMISIGLPLSLFAAAVVIFIAMFARSFKEAQSYLAIVVLIPALPGMLSILYPMDGKPWLAPFPVAGQYALASDVMNGQMPHLGYFVIAALSIVAVSLALVMLTTRMIRREAIIFGR